MERSFEKAGIERKEQVAFARYADGGLWRFHQGRVVLIGDASHSMSPQLGQGANLALIDAEKLVSQLEQRKDDGDIETAFEAYTRDRWWRLQFYQAQSRLLTPLFASRSETLRFLRNSFFYPMCHTPGLERFSHAVLCGAQSPNLLTPWATIPEEEFLGFLSDEGAAAY